MGWPVCSERETPADQVDHVAEREDSPLLRLQRQVRSRSLDGAGPETISLRVSQIGAEVGRRLNWSTRLFAPRCHSMLSVGVLELLPVRPTGFFGGGCVMAVLHGALVSKRSAPL